MKIVLISNMYPSEKKPVFGVFVKNIEKQLELFDVQIESKCVATRSTGAINKLVSYLKLYACIINAFFNKQNSLYYIHFPLQTSPLLILLNFFFKKKLVLNIHGSELNKKSIFYKSFCRLLLKAKLVVVPSEFYKNLLISEYQTLSDKIFVYPSGGVDNIMFKVKDKEVLFEKYKLNRDKIICSYISTISIQKGCYEFLDAAEILLKSENKFHFIVVGNGTSENTFKSEVENRNLSNNFTFFDRQKQSILVDFFNMTDVFIFPSHKESLGLVALEALTCGTPVIGNDIEPINSYIKDGYNGYLYKKGEAKDLARKVLLFSKMQLTIDFKENAIKSSIFFESKICTKLLATKLKEI